MGFEPINAQEARDLANQNMRATFSEIMADIDLAARQGKFSLKMEKDFCDHYPMLEDLGYSIIKEPSDKLLTGIICW